MNAAAAILVLAASLAAVPASRAAEPEIGASQPAPAAALTGNLEVDGQGVFLDQLVTPGPDQTIPHLRITNAPAPGKPLQLPRARVLEALTRHAPELALTQLAGPDTVRISRRVRELDEVELRALLTAALQKQAGDAGELEVRLGRPWTPCSAPDDPLSLRILDLPAAGIGPNMLIRFDLVAGQERFETYQLAVQCRLFREIPVARANLPRGQRLSDADVALERRDVFVLRDPLSPNALADDNLELAEPVRMHQPLLSRNVRPRPLIRRGGLVEGVIQDGSLTVTLKMEALEDGVAGQTMRLRNPRTRRECLGKVQNEQTVLLML